MHYFDHRIFIWLGLRRDLVLTLHRAGAQGHPPRAGGLELVARDIPGFGLRIWIHTCSLLYKHKATDERLQILLLFQLNSHLAGIVS